MADPLDFANADLPATDGGISPDAWRNLLIFGSGLSTAANARTSQGFLQYGPGFGGPLGAAIQGAAAQNLDTAKVRSGLGLQNAQTQDVRSQVLQRNIANKLGLYNLNLTSQLYGGPQYDDQGNILPAGARSPYSAGAPQQQSQAAPQQQQSAPAPPGGGTNYAALYGDPRSQGWDAANLTTVKSPSGVPFTVNKQAAPAFQGFLGDLEQTGYKIDPVTSGGYNLRNITGGNTLSPHAFGVAIDVNPPANPYSKTASGGTLQTNLPPNVADLAAKWGLDWGGNWSSLKDPMHFEYNPAQRTQVAQAGNGPLPMPSQGGGGPAPQQLAPQQPQQDPLAIAQGILQGHIQPTPQQALQAAPLIGRINPQLGQELMNFGLAGPKAAAVSQAQLPFVGPEQAAKSANSNVDIRPGGMVRITNQDGTQSWVKNPQLEKVQTPNGSEQYVHITPPLPNAPAGSAGESTPVLDASGQPAVAKIPPNVQGARNKAYEDFAGKDTDSYIAAQNTQSWLEQMNHAMDELNRNGGFLQTGPTSPSRLQFASTVNDVLRTMGIPNAFDPSKIASWEEFKKATTTAGFELSSHYEGHARQAAQTIINATSAVPSPENSPVGGLVVSAGIQEAAQSAIDLHQAKQGVYDQNGDLSKAETDFYKQNPAQMYARRAISRVTPYPITNDQQINRYLPGTFLRYKGNIVQAPERDGAPPIPEYLRGAAPYQAPQ